MELPDSCKWGPAWLWGTLSSRCHAHLAHHVFLNNILATTAQSSRPPPTLRLHQVRPWETCQDTSGDFVFNKLITDSLSVTFLDPLDSPPDAAGPVLQAAALCVPRGRECQGHNLGPTSTVVEAVAGIVEGGDKQVRVTWAPCAELG